MSGGGGCVANGNNNFIHTMHICIYIRSSSPNLLCAIVCAACASIIEPKFRLCCKLHALCMYAFEQGGESRGVAMVCAYKKVYINVDLWLDDWC